MEISNKAFGIICVTVVVVAAYVRAQTLHSTATTTTTAVVEAPKVVARAPKKRHGIPDSALPPSPVDASSDDQSIAGDTPITVDSVVPDQPPAAPVAKQPAAQPAETDNSNTGDEDLTNTDDLGSMAQNAPADNSLELSDRDMLRIMLSAMPNEQRESFRMMWFTMSPDDRQEFLNQLRASQQGG
jgi:hypothetical protein